jgi:multimeric flavodoxin WrbA
LPATRLHLSEYDLSPFQDRRHSPEGFPPLAGAGLALIEQFLSHDLYLFATPVHWYGMSGYMKNFVDLFSHAMREPHLRFRDTVRGREAFAVVVGDDNPRRTALPLIQQFGHLFDFLEMPYAGWIIGQGNKPGEIVQDTLAVLQAAWMRRELVSRLGAGVQKGGAS